MNDNFNDDFENLNDDEKLDYLKNKLNTIRNNIDNALPDEKQYNKAKRSMIFFSLGILLFTFFISVYLYNFGITNLYILKNTWFIIIPFAFAIIYWIYHLIYIYFSKVKIVNPNITQEDRDKALEIKNRLDIIGKNAKRIYSSVMFIVVIIILSAVTFFLVINR